MECRAITERRCIEIPVDPMHNEVNNTKPLTNELCKNEKGDV
jgi:hypothetical protein